MRDNDSLILESLYSTIFENSGLDAKSDKEKLQKMKDNAKTASLKRDENGYPIAWENEEYRIILNDANGSNHTSTTLMHKEFVKGKPYWAKRGRLLTDIATKKINGEIVEYAKVYVVEIEKAHRNKGLGTQLYKSLLEFMPSRLVGIGSNIDSRSDKKYIPKLYKKLNAVSYNDGSFELIKPI
jgi:predicted acetyltransferase